MQFSGIDAAIRDPCCNQHRLVQAVIQPAQQGRRYTASRRHRARV